MVIERGAAWGRTVPAPANLRVVDGDAALAAALTDGSDGPVAPVGGDLHRTVGARTPMGRTELLELPIDLISISIDGGRSMACAHVRIETPPVRGGWWRGPVVFVMNAQFLGDWQVTARGHPNDGRVEVCEWGDDFSIRDRWRVRQRLRTASHVPHPGITTKSVRSESWSFDSPMRVRVDGRDVGRSTKVEIVVIADAGRIYT